MSQTPKSAKKTKNAKRRAEDREPKSVNPTVEMVRELAALVEAHTLSELIVDLPEATITLRRGLSTALVQQQLAAPIAQQLVAAPMAATGTASEPAVSAGGDSADAADATNGAFHIITSPFVGTFYRRPNPDSSTYTEVGQRVEKGQVLCIVEAMKLMNEIEADIAGTVVAIIVEDSEPVEYGQPLFKISPV